MATHYMTAEEAAPLPFRDMLLDIARYAQTSARKAV